LPLVNLWWFHLIDKYQQSSLHPSNIWRVAWLVFGSNGVHLIIESERQFVYHSQKRVTRCQWVSYYCIQTPCYQR